MVRKVTFLVLLGASLAGVVSCGSEETIRVDLLPPGNARGSAATGMYAWSEEIAATDCPATVTVGGVTVGLPRKEQEFSACGDVVHDEGYYAIDLFVFSGPAGVTRPEFVADGGLWQEGQFRIGGIFAFGTGVTARALLDGQYLPPSGTEVARSFEGDGLIQVFQTGTGGETYLCEIRTRFNAHREPGCGAD
ncbi:MAG: hypothetical protein HY905_21465 [Deltaproteobacteria bacterium]|nr:hypothetical protein [Deltaproteobacteria bacterium]